MNKETVDWRKLEVDALIDQVRELEDTTKEAKARIEDLILKNRKFRPGDKVTLNGMSKNFGVIYSHKWDNGYSYQILIVDNNDDPEAFVSKTIVPEDRLSEGWT